MASGNRAVSYRAVRVFPNQSRRQSEERSALYHFFTHTSSSSSSSRVPVRASPVCGSQDHTLVGNCLSCGKIICAQEGLGPCTYCGVDYQGKIGKKPKPAASASGGCSACVWVCAAPLD